jgi:ankyrin repeat protein
MRGAAAGHYEVVKALLPTHPDVNALNSRGRSALSLAVGNGHYDVAKLLLDHEGINMDQTDHKSCTLLIHAMEGGNPDMIRLLFAHSNVKVNYQDKNGRTALSYAAENGHVAAIEVLQELQRKQLDGGLEDDHGHSPLQYAAQKGHVEAVRLLRNLAFLFSSSVAVANCVAKGIYVIAIC